MTNKQRRIIIKIKKIFTTSIILLFLLIICGVLGLAIHKPDFLTKIITNKLNSTFFFQPLKIIITGNNKISNQEIIDTTKNYLNQKYSSNTHISNISLTDLQNTLQNSFPWLKNTFLKRTLLNQLYINIIEYQPIALWFDGAEKFLVDKDGEIIISLNKIPNSEKADYENMLIFSGLGANKNIKSFFNIITINQNISNLIYSAHWVGERRWDIRLLDGTLIKMPENNIYNAWQNLTKIYTNNSEVKNLKTIDLRIENKIYLEYQNKKTETHKI
jgi:cell division septal protein FtsQ